MVEEKPLGTNVAKKTGLTVADLYGKQISLNLSMTKYWMPPSGNESMLLTADKPTTRIPDRDHVGESDMISIVRHLKAKHLVLGPVPVPEYQKVAGVLERHLSVVNMEVSFEIFEKEVFGIVNGPAMEGGYTKIEILESMYEAEELNPVTQRGGRNRAAVLEHLREAIKAVIAREGGVSKVRTSPEHFQHKLESSMRKPSPVELTKEEQRRFLGIEAGTEA